MSMLDGFKKQGGFEQLLLLIETSNQEKQQQFFALLETEDPSTAAMIRSKMLTVDKILLWDISFLSDILVHIPHSVLAIVLKNKPEKIIHQTLKAVNSTQKQKVLGLLEKTSEPSVGELESARIHFIQKVRELNGSGKIKLSKIAPELDVSGYKVA